MSPNAANSLVHDLVEMAKSHEALPLVQHELSDARVTIDAQQSTIQRLELKLLDRAGEIDEVRASLRKAEEDRDEATRAFLEADDRTEKVLAFLRSTMGNAQALLDAVDGPTVTPQSPQAIVEDTPTPTVDPGPAIDSHPFEPVVPMGIDFHGDATNIDSVSTAPTTDASVGQSEVDPTPAPSTESQSTSALSTAGNVVSALPMPTEMQQQDGIGYHNEPEWTDAAAWDDWCHRMTKRYPSGWPSRHGIAAQ